MFSSSSFDKSSFGPENSSPGRNLSNRFPVGIPTLPDENQQIRIQLAVHKYNNSASSSLSNGRSLIAPVRHSFLKNSLKAKSYEGEADTSLKSDKKSGNQYDGVGAFPTIHLKKSSVRYRPIKRFSEVKVPYPELPVNRFLSHLPELCPDLKSSTRSVLDVLQDLSGKKIDVKDGDESNKPRLKGLGGDYYLDPNAAYKPLFVQKLKINSVLTKDNTTQTLLSHSTDTPTSQCGSAIGKNDITDPRAELRRRLARQNNEIFASLSSSIPSSFAVKRKIERVPSATDDASSEVSAVKKSKLLENHTHNYDESDASNIVKNGKTNTNDSVKLSRKNKLMETSTPSPNKDRLTTIFLDMQNISPKSQMFPSKSPTNHVEKSPEDAAHLSTSTSNGMSNNTVESPHVNGSLEGGIAKNSSQGNSFTNSPNLNIVKLKAPNGIAETQPESNKVMVNFTTSSTASSTTASEVSKSNAITFQFGVNPSSNFTFPNNSVKDSSLVGGFQSTVTTAASNNSDVNAEKKAENDKTVVKPFTFGTSDEKPNFSNFKFGNSGNTSAVPNADQNKSPIVTSAPAVVTAPTTSTSVATAVPQFSFGTKITEGSTVPGGIQFGQATTSNVSSNQNTLTTPAKPLPTFGQNLTAPQSLKKIEEKTETSKSGVPTTTTNGLILSQGAQSTGMFTFGQKAPADSKNEDKSTADAADTKDTAALANPFSQNTTSAVTTPSFTSPLTSQTTSFLQNSTAGGGLKSGANSLFLFGQKPEVSTAAPTVTTAESKSQSTFPFTFGQKADSVETKSTENLFGQKPPTNLFTFGQKTSEPSGRTAVQSDANQSSSQNSLKPQPASTSSLIFGQSVSQATTASHVPAFGQTSTSVTTTTNAFGAKSESVSFGQMSTPAFGENNSAFTNKTSLFPSSTATQPSSGFGTSTTTQPASGFGTSTSGVGFGVPTSQSTPAFGAPVSTQSVVSFGASTSQPGPGFGAPSSTASTIGFGGTTQSAPGFGVAGFGSTSSATTQSSLGFGTPATQATTGFGLGASSPSFAQSFNKPSTSLGQTPSIFGSTTMNQNPVSSTSFGSTPNAGQNNVFGQKTNPDAGIFGAANKIQTPGFGQTEASQSFGTPSKFALGMSTSNATGFTTSPPNTTAAPVFNFGGGSSAQSSTFSFGSSSSANPQSPFAFKGASNETFKFGASAPKEGTGFGGATTSTFSFGGQMNNTMNNAMGETKQPAGVFSFGNSQVSSSSPRFNFGTTPSPSVFSFGASGSAASSGSSFSFGTPQPGGPFGQSGTPSPAPPFVVPGTFSIGSGSSQSRPRASTRLRRRP